MDLTTVGLTKNEAKAFKALLRLGKSSASIISKEAKVPYSRIYNILASLEHKGLVRVIPEKSKKFVPGDPAILKELIQKRKIELDETEKEIDKFKTVYEMQEKEPVQISKGKRNFYKTMKELPSAEKLEYNIKYYSEIKPEWLKGEKRKIKKGIDIKELVRFDKETEENVRKWMKIHKNMRSIKNEGIAVSIRDDKAILITLIKSNTILLIRDKSFVKLMVELFRKYYENSEQIKL